MRGDRLDRLASSLVMAGVAGEGLTPGERKILASGLIGHLILFERSLKEPGRVRALIREARRLSGRKMLVAADQEGGIVSVARRVAAAAPSAMHLGAIDDPSLVGRWARRQGASLLRLGIDMNLAPVLDVAGGRTDGVIGTRSYGGSPRLVARLGAAAVRGSLRAGVIPVGKHFPDHGAVRSDSHLGLPVDRRSRREILATSLIPYRAAIAAGLPVVMAAHVAYPALGGGRSPATLASSVLGDLLRRRLRFDGVVLSDAIEMHAFPGEGAVAGALRAGVDLLCAGRSLAQGARIARRIARALRKGELEQSAARTSAARIGRLVDLAGRGGKAAPPMPRSDAWKGIAHSGRKPFRPLGGGRWRILLPARLAGRISLPLDLSRVEARFGATFLRERVRLFPFDPSPGQVGRLLDETRRLPALALGLVGRGDLPQGQKTLLRRLARRRCRLIALSLLDAEPLAGKERLERLFTFDLGAETLDALFRVLTGEKRPEGRFPIGIR